MPSDTALLRSIITHQISIQVGRFTVRVEPRPLEPDPDITEVEVGLLGTWSHPAVGPRKSLLTEMGVPTTDALADARGVSAFPPPDVRERQVGCPAAYYTSVAAAVPRQGGPGWPDQDVDGTAVPQDERPTPPGAFTVRVVLRTVQPHGAVRSVWDYVFVRSRGVWQIHEVVNLFVAG